MVKNCTSIEQSKRLLELGLNPDTADMHYTVVGDLSASSYTEGLVNAGSIAKAWHKNPEELKAKVVPAWSLSALLNLTPDIIGDYVLRLDKVDGDYYIWYDEIGKGWSDDMPHPSSDNFIDVAYKNLVLLLENKKI